MRLSISTRYALCSLRRHLRRTILAILGIGLGSAICLFMIAFVRGEGKMMLKAAAESGAGHLRVVPAQWPETRENDLRLNDWENVRRLMRDCEGVTAYIGNCVADAIFDQCSLNTITAPGLQGGLSFANCRFQPNLQEAEGDIYTLDATLGTRLVNCAILAPLIAGEQQPELVNRSGIIEINGAVRGYHINTALGNHVINYCEDAGIAFDPAFIEKLKLHHALEE